MRRPIVRTACSVCAGEGGGPTSTGARFDDAEQTWWPDEAWVRCARCRGSGWTERCARCGVELGLDPTRPCRCSSGARGAPDGREAA